MRFTTMTGMSLAVALAAVPPLGAQLPDWNWHGRVATGQTLEIRGINGEIKAVAADGADVEVTARFREGDRGDARDVHVAVLEHDGGVTICAVYPGSRHGQPNACRPGGGGQNVRDNDTKVDFTVRVPAGVHLSAHSVNGDVTAEGIGSDVQAGTVNGDVNVTAAGHVDAHTVNGSIRARMGRGDWSGELSFSTVNGNITVNLPDGVGANVSASTVNGGIDTDFPLTVRGRFGPQRISGSIGGGGSRSLSLTTVNGGIRLRRGS